jgi:GTP-binding protein Era
MFVDPPGLLEPRYLLQQAMLQQALAHLARADAIVYLHPADAGEAAPLETLLPPEVRVRAPVLSVLTKADLIPADRPHANLLPISAVTGEGLDALLAWCRDHAPEGPFRHDPEELSTQPVRFFVTEFVREAAFEVLGEELPYAVAVQVDEFREADDPVYIRLTLYVERNSQKGMVIGSKGRTIKALGELARHKIESLLEARVYLDLWVKVLPKWRTRPHALRQLGFPAPAGRSR